MEVVNKHSLTKINSDLESERRKCTFNTIELTNFLDGGAEKTKARRELGKHNFGSSIISRHRIVTCSLFYISEVLISQLCFTHRP
jgi:hypothetical protein